MLRGSKAEGGGWEMIEGDHQQNSCNSEAWLLRPARKPSLGSRCKSRHQLLDSALH